MGHPIGLPSEQLEDGTWVGMTPLGMQRAIGQMYNNPGIVPGNRSQIHVEGTSGWSYKVPACTAFAWISEAERRAVLIPVEGATMPVSAPSGGSSRTDMIYVDLQGITRVAEGRTASTAPGGGVVIDRMVIPAGASNTQGAVSNFDVRYAVPVGASLGLLHRFHDPANNIFGNVAPLPLGQGRFTLPSDRLVRFDMTHCISAEQDSDPTRGEATVMRWKVYVDDLLELAFTSRAEWDNPQTNFMSFTKWMTAGEHTVHYVQDRLKGARFKHHKGTADGYAGNRFEVWDAGAME